MVAGQTTDEGIHFWKCECGLIEQVASYCIDASLLNLSVSCQLLHALTFEDMNVRKENRLQALKRKIQNGYRQTILHRFTYDCTCDLADADNQFERLIRGFDGEIDCRIAGLYEPSWGVTSLLMRTMELKRSLNEYREICKLELLPIHRNCGYNLSQEIDSKFGEFMDLHAECLHLMSIVKAISCDHRYDMQGMIGHFKLLTQQIGAEIGYPLLTETKTTSVVLCTICEAHFQSLTFRHTRNASGLKDEEYQCVSSRMPMHRLSRFLNRVRRFKTDSKIGESLRKQFFLR